MNEAQDPVCSVCIANYNGEAMLAECIDSVLAQTGNVPVEIIVHDDASTDGSLATLTRYKTVHVIASTDNRGFCVANNRMAAQSRGEFVLLLNNDAALLPDALDALLEIARGNNASCIVTLPQYDWNTDALVDRGCMLDPFYNPVPNVDPARSRVAMTIGACMFLHRTLWNELGGFPESMGSIGEDLFLCCTARLRGFEVLVAARSGYRHRQGATFGGNRAKEGRLHSTYRRRFLSERNKTSSLFVCTPTWLVWPLCTLHILLLALEGLVLTMLRRDRETWLRVYGPCLKGFLVELPALRRKRRIEQRLRRISLGSYLKRFVLVPRKLTLLLRFGLPRLR